MNVGVGHVSPAQLALREHGCRRRRRFQQTLVPDPLTQAETRNEDEEESEESRGAYQAGFHLIFPDDEVLPVHGRL